MDAMSGMGQPDRLEPTAGPADVRYAAHYAAARSSLSAPRATNHQVGIWPRPLQRLGLVPWRAHPNVARFLSGQYHRHCLVMG
jgi:hypothetical protein